MGTDARYGEAYKKEPLDPEVMTLCGVSDFRTNG